jgi:hypothetical protein
MDVGTTNLDAIATELRGWPTVFFRMLLRKASETTWQADRLLIDAVAEDETPALERHFMYDYGDITVVGGSEEGRVAALWLTRPGDRHVEVIDAHGGTQTLTFSLTGLPQDSGMSASWIRYPSGRTSDLGPLPWPHCVFSVNLQATPPSIPDRVFVAEGCPFFPDLGSLVSRLLYSSENEYQPYKRYDQPALHIRIAQTDAAIERIHISATAISVTAKGRNIKGTRLEIGGQPDVRGEAHFGDEHVQQGAGGLQRGTLTVQLQSAVPRKLWIVLSRGNEWLDHRQLDAAWSPFAQKEGGLTIEPPEPGAQVQEYIYQGEGPRIEFKLHVPGEHEKMLKTVAAFANGDGGVILIGVRNGDGEILGAAPNAPAIDKLIDDITNWIRTIVVPEPLTEIRRVDVGGKTVVAIFVDAGSAPPYAITPAKPVYYVRRGATSFPARPDEIRALVLSKSLGPAIR